MGVAIQKVSAAFRFSPEVMAELDRKRALIGLTKTEFLVRIIMSDAMPVDPLEARIQVLEARLNELERLFAPDGCAH